MSVRVAYGFIGALGVTAFFLGVFRISSIIREPGERTAQQRQQVVDRVETANKAAEEQMRIQDTDQDGLTDFNELNLYGTSPYLPDTDSDGFSDKQEIDTGNDPNCPVGQNCRSVPAVDDNPVIDENGVVIDNFGDLLVEPLPETAPAVDLTDLSVEEVRELMLQSGEISQAQLDEIDDETLMQIYQEVINGSSQTQTQN